MNNRCSEVCPKGWAEGERCIYEEGHVKYDGGVIHDAKALAGDTQGTSWIKNGDWANCLSGRFAPPAPSLADEVEILKAEKKQLLAALKKLFLATSHKGIPKFGSMAAIYEEITDALKLGEESDV